MCQAVRSLHSLRDMAPDILKKHLGEQMLEIHHLQQSYSARGSVVLHFLLLQINLMIRLVSVLL